MIRIALLLVLTLSASICPAHGTADNHLQIMVIDNRVKMNITVDMRVLQAVDMDKDGYASLAELAEHHASFRTWVAKLFDVSDQNGNTGAVVFADVTSDLNIASEFGDRVDHARIVQAMQFAAAPKELQLNLGAIAALIPELRVTVIDASSGLTYKLLDPMRSQSVPMPGNGNDDPANPLPADL
jgi:hypothetical protein